MRGIFTLFSVLYCAVLATAFVPYLGIDLGAPTEPTPCKTALQWEGRFSEWDHNTGTNNRYTISYDGVKRRKWVEEEQKSMRPGRRLFKFLVLFDEQVEYKIDLSYNKCSKIPIGPWRNFSIPPLALYEDEYQIGGPKGNLDVIEWSDRQPARRRESWIGGFTKTGCWPVFEIFTFDNDSVSVAFTTRFFDLTPGINNMSVFDVPELCKAATAEPPPSRGPEAPMDEGLWNRWTPNWFKKWFIPEQRIDFGGLVAPTDVPDPSAEVPGTEETSPSIPSWVPSWFKKWFGKQKIDLGGLVAPSDDDVPGASTQVPGTEDETGIPSSSDLPSRDRNRYNTFRGSKGETNSGKWVHWDEWGK